MIGIQAVWSNPLRVGQAWPISDGCRRQPDRRLIGTTAVRAAVPRMRSPSRADAYGMRSPRPLTTMDTRSTGHNILVVNHHGDNRGDEAALRGLAEGMRRHLGDIRLTVIHQYSDPGSEVALQVPVRYLSMRLGVLGFAALTAYTALRSFRIDVGRALRGRVGDIVRAYSEADLVISAPGGPYFGDIYADHEIAHWLFVWLAHVRGAKVVLYAPSLGPFRNRLLNPIRRIGFSWFDVVTVRESMSADMLARLTNGSLRAAVTADSALQHSPQLAGNIPILQRNDGALLLAVAVRDPGPANPRHDQAIVLAITEACRLHPVDVVFLPQVHGPRHRDEPYLRSLAQRVEHARSVVVIDDNATSDVHREVVARADVVMAGRYHPAVFAVASATPVVVIPYEHKARGLAEAAGIGSWVIDASDVTAEKLTRLLLDLVAQRAEVRNTLLGTGPLMIAEAGRTSSLAAEILVGQSIGNESESE